MIKPQRSIGVLEGVFMLPKQECFKWPHCSQSCCPYITYKLNLSAFYSLYFEQKRKTQQFLAEVEPLNQLVKRMAPAKILIGISLDSDDSKELLSWAIRILTRPNDTVVALHVLGEDMKKPELMTKDQTRFRRAKAFVISMVGEFAETCRSKQISLEVQVGFNSSVGKGLIEEAKSISAEFLLIGGSRSRSNRLSRKKTRYCFENAPEGCAVISIGKCGKPQKHSDSNCSYYEEFRRSKKEVVSAVQKLVTSKSNREKATPKALMLDGSEVESGSTEDSFSFGDSISITESPPVCKLKGGQSNLRKQLSPLKTISSFFLSPFDLSGRKRNEGLSDKEKHQPLLRCFSYEEISKATNNFHPDNMVGRGGYSEVYRGDLDNGQTVAVKRLAKENADENKEKEFLMELGIIGHVCHPNTANLVGCCIENGLHLVFNFSPNGTLSAALHGKTSKPLEWSVRYKIATGVARGLHYLHKCCKHRIIHRDIKASNVLLGADFEPQISDFGLAKWLPSKWTHHSVIPIEGTFGYLAPEYFMHGIVDEKTDVFAFGVLLLEIITGRRPVDSSKQNLLLWAKPLMESGDIFELADPKLGGRYDVEQMCRLVLTASYCVRQTSIWRPSMTEVLELLRDGDDSAVARRWRVPKYTSHEMDDHYSMVFAPDDHVPLTDIILDDDDY